MISRFSFPYHFIILLLLQWVSPGRAEDLIEELLNRKSLYQDVLVIDVIDPAIIRLESGEKIRLIGLKAPEKPPEKPPLRNDFGIILKEEPNPVISVGQQAFDFVNYLLENKHVHLEFDTARKDEELMTLAYVFLEDGSLVNAEIIRQGYAYLKLSPPNFKYKEQLTKAYQEAYREKRGIHGE